MMRIVLEVIAEELAKEVDKVVEGDDRMLLFDFRRRLGCIDL